MIDAALQPLLGRFMAGPARALAARGVQADQVTLAAFGLGVLAVPALAAGWYLAALALILLNRLGDGVDGALARATQPTDRGAFLDISLDFLFYALVPVGFALADPAANALPAAVLIAAFVGTGSSFLAFAVIAERRGIKAGDYPRKGIHYLGGLTEGTETIGVFVLMCLWPAAFPVLALGFAALCAITTATRWHAGWRMFR
ncbi:MAG: CDP-alcohol phosphatidyltransferase family protein [Paracoccaceae bacterium]|nr:MAG: CDP-alcohol phosphatidyltransferase family protein [Paracoccaceae bacterium]